MTNDHCGTSRDRPDDEVSDEPVCDLRFKLVFKFSDVRAAEGTREDCQEGSGGGCDVFVAPEGRDRGRIAGQCGHVLVSYQPVLQSEMKPVTFDEEEPGILAKGLDPGLRLSFDVIRDAGPD
jgi:hypothetical protein